MAFTHLQGFCTSPFSGGLPAMRRIAGGRAVDGQAAPTGQMARFKTSILACAHNLATLADLPGQWIDAIHKAHPPRWITLDMDSSVSSAHGDQEGTAWNGHFGCKCHHPLLVFNRFGDPERCALRKGNVHGADGRKEVLALVIARYKARNLMRFFRAGAAFAISRFYGMLETEGCFQAVCLRA